MYNGQSPYMCYICIGKYNQLHYAEVNSFSWSTVLTRAPKTGFKKEIETFEQSTQKILINPHLDSTVSLAAN